MVAVVEGIVCEVVVDANVPIVYVVRILVVVLLILLVLEPFFVPRLTHYSLVSVVERQIFVEHKMVRLFVVPLFVPVRLKFLI